MRQIAWDTEVPGLGIRKKKGGDIWLLKYRVAGRQVMEILGPVGMLDEVSARALARKAKWEGKKGIGPEAKSRTPRLTIAQLCDHYIEKHSPKTEESTRKKDLGRIKTYIKPLLGSKEISKVTLEDLEKLHSDISKRPAPIAANRVIEQLNMMYKLAKDWKYLPKGFENPAQFRRRGSTIGIIRNPEKKHVRWLKDAELTRLIDVLKEQKLVIRTFYMMLLLTACRYGEMQKLRWEDVDLEGGRIWLGKTKNGEPHMVPLAAQGVELLTMLREESGDWGYVFKSPADARTYFANIARYWRDEKKNGKLYRKGIKTLAKLGKARIHDLRHTTATQLLASGAHIRDVSELLNHKSMQSTMRYGHAVKEHLRPSLQSYAASKLSNTIERCTLAKLPRKESHALDVREA